MTFAQNAFDREWFSLISFSMCSDLRSDIRLRRSDFYSEIHLPRGTFGLIFWPQSDFCSDIIFKMLALKFFCLEVIFDLQFVRLKMIIVQKLVCL